MMLLYFFMYMLIILMVSGLLTVFERNFLGLSQIRFGPKKVSFLGFFQMIFDGVKLFFSESLIIIKSDEYFFLMTSMMSFILMLLIFWFLFFYYNIVSWLWSFLFLFMQISYSIFSFLLNSFFSKSKYSYLGSIRVSVGALSFDIVFIFFSLFFIIIFKDYSLYIIYYLIFMYKMVMIFFILMMVELNRAPFDFSEGESELVSGLNTELSGLYFVYFFLSEYGMMLFYGLMMNEIIFMGNFCFGFLIFFFMIFIRSCFPRFRYDYLMSMCWLVFLPLETFMLFFLFFLFSISIMIKYFYFKHKSLLFVIGMVIFNNYYK